MSRIKTSTLEALVWIALYGGLLVLVLGHFVGRHDAVLGVGMQVAGGTAATVGVLLIWLRSRRPEP